MSSGLLQVFVELGNLLGTSNYVLYWNHGGRQFWFRLPYPGTSVKYSCILLACSEDWTVVRIEPATWRLQVQSSLQASNIQEYLTLVPGVGG